MFNELCTYIQPFGCKWLSGQDEGHLYARIGLIMYIPIGEQGKSGKSGDKGSRGERGEEV